MRIRVGQLMLDVVTASDAAVTIIEMADQRRPGLIATSHIHHLALAESLEGYAGMVNSAALNVADGWPLVAASRILGRPLPQRIAGIDLVADVLSRSQGLRLAVLGGPDGAAARLAARFSDAHEVVLVEPLRPGEWETGCARDLLRERVLAAAPTLTLVGLGAPRQEILGTELLDVVAGPVVGCGAGIEVLGGMRPRAPRAMQRFGLEWAFRAACEPRRLLPRYIRDGAVLLRVLKRELLHPRRGGFSLCRQHPQDVARTPNLFLVGAPKTGTTSLYEYLARAEDVFMSPLKEPHFFSGHFILDVHRYLSLFSGAANEKWIGEASTSYLASEAALSSLKEFSPGARIIICVRDPVARAISHYANDVYEGIEKRSFSSAIQHELAAGDRVSWPALYVRQGLYADDISRYFDAFGRDKVLVLFAEDLKRDAQAVVRQLAEFLGLLDLPTEVDRQNVLKGKGPRNSLSRLALRSRQRRRVFRAVLPEAIKHILRPLVWSDHVVDVDPVTVQCLEGHFAVEAARLEDLLARPLPWPWLEKRANRVGSL